MKNKLFTLIVHKLRIAWHILFWCAAFFILLRLFSLSESTEKIDLIYTAIFILPLMMAVYINLYLAIPSLLKKQRILLFLLSAGSLIALSAALIYKLFESWTDILFKDLYFIAYDEYSIILIYSLVFVFLSTLLKLSKEWMIYLRAEQENKISELKNLHAQINPHFLLNSLQTIYSQSLDKDPQSPKTILGLSEILKYNLYESADEVVLLEREIAIIKEYIVLRKQRIDESRANIQMNIDGEIDAQKIAPMLFLPFIENAFKHGVQSLEKDAWIHIHFQVSKNHLNFNIENNKGKSENTESIIYSGIGIQNTKKRLELMYPGKHELQQSECDETFRINLKISLS